MTKPFGIDYWTEEYRKCMEEPGHTIRNYMRIKEVDGTVRPPTSEEVETSIIPDGATLDFSLPEELYMGGFNYENRVKGNVGSAQQIINRLMSQIAYDEAKKKQP